MCTDYVNVSGIFSNLFPHTWLPRNIQIKGAIQFHRWNTETDGNTISSKEERKNFHLWIILLVYHILTNNNNNNNNNNNVEE